MVGISFEPHRPPVQLLIYIPIAALSRHLVIDVQQVSGGFALYLLLNITGAIVLLCRGISTLTHAARRLGAQRRMTCAGLEIQVKPRPVPRVTALGDPFFSRAIGNLRGYRVAQSDRAGGI